MRSAKCDVQQSLLLIYDNIEGKARGEGVGVQSSRL